MEVCNIFFLSVLVSMKYIDSLRQLLVLRARLVEEFECFFYICVGEKVC